MKTRPPWIPDALWRLIIAFAIIIAVVIVVRMLIPPELKDKAMHYSSTVDRESAKPVRYAGSSICAECHEEFELKKKGYHLNLSCETCHGPSVKHTEDPSAVKPDVPRKREFCTHCHVYDPSRPTGFPQINPAAHNPMQPCVGCHNPHDPKPPKTPEECRACHEEIARTKSVSPHVMLECTVCHGVPQEHKLSPRAVKATIPAGRDFCGTCHSKESAVKGTPKIDILTHNEKYVCWQCHYPHMPEVD
jgi:hypothetical protein